MQTILLGRQIGGPSRIVDGTRDARSRREVGFQPVAKRVHAGSREECFVIIGHEIRDLQTGAGVEEDSRSFAASFAESNKFQCCTLASAT